MANDRDDDLLNDGNDAFYEDEQGEFMLPDDQDGDVLDDQLEFSDDDVVDMSDSGEFPDDNGFFDEPGTESAGSAQAASLDDVQMSDEFGESEYPEESQDRANMLDNGDTESSNNGIGWKAWAGLAAFAIVASAGMAYVVLPSDPAPAQAQQQSLPKPPPAPTQASNGSNQQAPVQVSPFPDSPASQSSRMPTDRSASAGGSGIIPDPQMQRPMDREPGYLAALDEQREDFASVRSIADENMFRLTQLTERFDEFEVETNDELGSLDKRVTDLENLIASGGVPAKSSTSTASTSKASDMKGSDGFVYKVPKTPAEIKSLQRTLKEFGYRPGAIDGILGDQTRWAIKRLQQEHGLAVNGWLSGETMMALQNPKQYSGTYPKANKKAVAKTRKKTAPKAPAGGTMTTPTGNTIRWYVRGVTPTKAIVYRQDGLSYAVKVGSEIPGMGQVTELDTDSVEVITAKGVIARR